MSDDPELEAIRRKRMAELQSQSATSRPSGKDEEEQRNAIERRKGILLQILEPEARERLSRVALVKPEKARQVEDSIIRAAQMGALKSRIDEQRIIQMLEQMADNTSKTTITIRRKNYDDDD
eukprot:TRINITY_DN496_c2_g1_i2.p1 TRINITY_DN496_c2_g1~~TRINITY_DN496_c2_g1_i2.p1  ORF type:complete len:122 (+),score=67.26 TRINITY_DN496_c2_g1_i2:153-518(+)